MNLVIKDIEMPLCCDDCFAYDGDGDYPYCRITHRMMGYTFQATQYHMLHCPLHIQLTTDDTSYWADMPRGALQTKCAHCNSMHSIFEHNKYCPNCGRRMTNGTN